MSLSTHVSVQQVGFPYVPSPVCRHFIHIHWHLLTSILTSCFCRAGMFATPERCVLRPLRRLDSPQCLIINQLFTRTSRSVNFSAKTWWWFKGQMEMSKGREDVPRWHRSCVETRSGTNTQVCHRPALFQVCVPFNPWEAPRFWGISKCSTSKQNTLARFTCKHDSKCASDVVQWCRRTAEPTRKAKQASESAAIYIFLLLHFRIENCESIISNTQSTWSRACQRAKFKYTSSLGNENVVEKPGLAARISAVPNSFKHHHPVPLVLFWQ